MNDESFHFSIEHQVAKGPSSRFWVSEKTQIFKGFLLLSTRKEMRKEIKNRQMKTWLSWLEDCVTQGNVKQMI